MSTATLQCVVRCRGGGEVKKVAEVVGEGRSYLASLSDNLSRMQSEVNAYLTEQVEKEKGEKTGCSAPPRRGSNGGGSSEDEDMDEEDEDDCGTDKAPAAKKPKS